MLTLSARLLFTCLFLLGGAFGQIAFPESDLRAPSAAVVEALKDMATEKATGTRQVLKELAEKEDLNALLLLAHCWEQGVGGPQSAGRAAELFKQAAEQESVVAMRRVGALYRSGGVGLRPSYQKARKWFEKAMDAGDSVGMLEMGYLYEKGLGVQADVDRALFLYRQAAENDLPEAMTHLGVCAMNGVGLDGKSDEDQALVWFEKAAAAGAPLAMFHVGKFHDAGRAGLPPDSEKASRWLKKAAAAGLAIAQNQMATRYRDGRGVDVDVAEAVRLFNAAASQGFSPAMVNLGVLYQDGASGSLAKDIDRAAGYYAEAAKRHDRVGQFLLSKLYAAGSGVPRDPVAAYVLADESNRLGYKPAEQLAETLRKTLDPQQLNEADARLRSLRVPRQGD